MKAGALVVSSRSLISRVTNRDIWDKDPSVYFKEFRKSNKELNKALESHFIGDLDIFGIEEDNYMKFLEERGKLISDKIKKFIETLQ